MWRASLAVVAACSFSARGGSDGGDGRAMARCTIVAAGAAVDTGVLGGSGGTVQPDLLCPGNELPVGIGFDMSRDPIGMHNDERVAVFAHVSCATIAVDVNDVVTTTVDTVITAPPGQTTPCNPYYPTTPVADVDCPPGSALVGVAGNKADQSLYNTVAIACAPLSASGQPSSSSTTRAITGTASYTNDPQIVACAPGTAIVAFGVQSGCGQDELVVRCGTLACR